MKSRKARVDSVLRYFIIIVGVFMLAESAAVYVLTDSIRTVISPDLLTASLAYVFLRAAAGIVFLYYAFFLARSR